jgi:DNA-binding transcriptional LysR family regulator
MGVGAMRSDGLQGIIPFVQVVEAGSFTLAAERLRLTTSAVGKSIAQMEKRLGVRLLNRSTRSLSLTSEGEAYYKACTAALSEIDTAQSQLAAQRQAPSGRLRIDLPLAFGRRCIAPVLFEIVRQYPDLSLEASFNDRYVDLVEEGLDLAIRVGELGDGVGIVARKLFAWRSTVCASPAYLMTNGVPADIDDLMGGHTLVVYGRGGTISPWLLRDRDGRSRTVTPHGRIILGHGEPLLDAVLAGLGVAYLPTWLIGDYLKRRELVMVWPDSFVENFPVHALWPKTRSVAPKVRVVVDALVERFSPPPWDQV